MMYPVVRELAGDGTPLATGCRVLQVSTSGFYEWNTRRPSPRDLEQAYLMNEIDPRRPQGLLRHLRPPPHPPPELVLGKHRAVSPGRVARLMKCTGLQGITRRRLHGCTRRDETAVDVFSRRVVGWAMADHLRAELVVDALQMAIWQRRPGPGAIHHSDHGSIHQLGVRAAAP
jgi:putative transposase